MSQSTSHQRYSRAQFPTLPEGEIVGSFATYESAQAGIDALARSEFPVEQVSIVGSDLKSVERVIGRMNYGRAALAGLANGVMIGMFMTLIWLIMLPQTPMATLGAIFLISIGFGVIWGIIGYAITPTKREFTSMMQLTASHFDVVVPSQLAGRARELLRGARTDGRVVGPGVAAAGWPQAPAGGPSQPGVPHYGTPQQPQPGAPQQPGAPTPYGGPTAYGAPNPYGGQPQGPGGQPQGQGAPGPAPHPDAAQAGANPQTGVPAQPPRTYSEAQAELRRREREAARSRTQPTGERAPGDHAADSNGPDSSGSHRS